jgi:hypothetical protein
MAITDFFRAINESSQLLEKNLRGIAVPLAVILLMSVASGLAGFLLSQAIQFLPFVSLAGQTPKPMQDTGMADIFLFAFAALILLSMLVSWLTCAISLYIAQHFNSVMTKKKMPEGWVGVMAGNLFKSLAMFILMSAILAAISAIPAVFLYFISTQLSGMAILAAGAAAILAIALLFSVASFFLSPLWIYYAIDKNGIFQSIGKSITLVRGNLSAFFLLYVVFVIISFGAAMFSSLLCCFSFVLSPLAMALVTMLYQITMMRIKLDSELPQAQGKK